MASQHAAAMYWDLPHLDLKIAFLQGETYDLDRRIIHVQLTIYLPPYLVGLCARSVYGLADAPRRWWNRLDKFHQISDFAWHSTNKSGQVHICVL